jgi:hypothetical protein
MKMDTKIDCCRKNLISDLTKTWAKKNLEIEIGIIMGERKTYDQQEEELKNWVLSTVEKRKFYLHLIRASMDNCPVTVQELVNLGVASRQSIEGFVKECEEADWISVCRIEKERKITAKPNLIDLYVKYCGWLADTYYTAEMSYLTSSIKYLKSLNDDHECVNLVDTSV